MGRQKAGCSVLLLSLLALTDQKNSLHSSQSLNSRAIPVVTMATLVDTVPLPPNQSQYETTYDPKKILAHPEFQVLKNDDPALKDKSKNLSCAYNEKHEVHMINKPIPKAGKGECVVHVRATGICG